MLLSVRQLAQRAPFRLALLACLGCLPALAAGLVLDDYYLAQRAREGLAASILHGFTFVERGQLPALREQGTLPWWSDPDLTLDFFRPLSALTHWFDFRFVRVPWLMHVESILLLLALNVVAYRWYARLFPGAPRVRALATALYLLAPGHAFAAAWLANRNSLLAALFAVLFLHAYARASEGERRYGLLAPVALLASFAAGEVGLSTVGLALAYAVTLDRRDSRARLLTLLPVVSLAIAWVALYHELGYGARASSLYVAATSDPLAYARALVERIPILLFAEWALPIASFSIVLSRVAFGWFALVSAAAVATLAPGIAQIWRSDARARFSLLATLSCLLPIASTVPHDRLLVIADLPGCALLALLVERAAASAAGSALRLVVRARLVLGALLIPAYAASVAQQAATFHGPFERSLLEPSLASQTLVFVSLPVAYMTAFLPLQRAHHGRPAPRRMRLLAPSIHGFTLTRSDAFTLRLHAPAGLLQPLGTSRSEERSALGWLSPVYLAQALNHFVRRDWSLRPGARSVLSDMTVEVLEVTADGYPRRVSFRFREPLESPRYRFVRWSEGGLVPFALPPPGGALFFPALAR